MASNRRERATQESGFALTVPAAVDVVSSTGGCQVFEAT